MFKFSIGLFLIVAFMNACIYVQNIGCVDGNKPEVQYKYRQILNKPDATIPPIIRLKYKDKFFCTGFIIDGRYAVTAAHCVVNSYGFFNNKEINIYDLYNKDTGIKAKPLGFSNRMDYAVIEGDFRNFAYFNIDNRSIGEASPENIYISCGFPFNQELTCSRVFPVSNYFFAIKAAGVLYPGQSGGPVIEINTNTVIGVNSAVGNNYIIFYPMTGLLELFNLL